MAFAVPVMKNNYKLHQSMKKGMNISSKDVDKSKISSYGSKSSSYTMSKKGESIKKFEPMTERNKENSSRSFSSFIDNFKSKNRINR